MEKIQIEKMFNPYREKCKIDKMMRKYKVSNSDNAR